MKGYSIANRLSYLSFFIMFIVSAFCPGVASSSQATESSIIPSININDDRHRPEDLLLGYTEKLNHLGESEGGVSLLLYRDSYVIVYYPAYMRRAGTYGMYLEEGVMSQLWALLTSESTLALNEEAVRQKIQTLDQAKAEASASLSSVGDAATTTLEIYPNRYQSVGFGNGHANEIKKISWHGLKWGASQHPEIQEIQDLVMIRKVLLEITEHADLERLE